MKPIDAAEDLNDEIAALVQKLHETEQRLQELMGSEVDAVLYPGGQSYLLHEAQEKLRRSEAAQRSLASVQSSILNALPAHIALIDHEGVIISVNDGWRSFAGTTASRVQAADRGKTIWRFATGPMETTPKKRSRPPPGFVRCSAARSRNSRSSIRAMHPPSSAGSS